MQPQPLRADSPKLFPPNNAPTNAKIIIITASPKSIILIGVA